MADSLGFWLFLVNPEHPKHATSHGLGWHNGGHILFPL
jgi:hypothetical protein